MDILKHVEKDGTTEDGYAKFIITPSNTYKAMSDYANELIENDTPMGEIPQRQRS